MKRQTNKRSSIAHFIASAIKYVTIDMWRITGRDITSSRRYFFINMLKTFYISIKHFVACDLYKKASALTFSTLLAVIPMLAILFAIAKGFGFQNIIQSQLFDYFPSNREALTHALDFIEAYLNEAKSGVFVGIGLIYLLWTVIGLIANVEGVMNDIWGAKNRTIYRQITDYTWVFLLLPVLMVASSGISIFITTMIDNSNYLHFISPLVRNAISFSPFFLSSLLFTAVYALVPNTRVQLRYALVAGVLCGVAFQGFQYLYLNGQIWVSRYNAIYGSFAFLPLLLLWIHLSWAICLFGAVFTYSSQNIQIYNFANEIDNISRRYKDFVALVIASIVVKRFAGELTPLTVSELSSQYGIPLRLANEVMNRLLEIGVVSEVVTADDRVNAYQPALDINCITAGMVLSRLDQEGEENFDIDKNANYQETWQCLRGCKEAMYGVGNDTLLKDLDCTLEE